MQAKFRRFRLDCLHLLNAGKCRPQILFVFGWLLNLLISTRKMSTVVADSEIPVKLVVHVCSTVYPLSISIETSPNYNYDKTENHSSRKEGPGFFYSRLIPSRSFFYTVLVRTSPTLSILSKLHSAGKKRAIGETWSMLSDNNWNVNQTRLPTEYTAWRQRAVTGN